MKTNEQYAAQQQAEKQAQESGYVVSFTYEDGRYAPFEERPITGIRFAKNEGVSLKRCQEFAKKIHEKFGDTGLVRFKIHMTQYDYNTDLDTYIGACFGDWGLPILGKLKDAVYDVRTNTLTIYQDHAVVYENANGVICRDDVALADSYL